MFNIFKKKQEIPKPVKQKRLAMAVESHEKAFDWAHYERTLMEQGVFGDEHRVAADARTMIAVYAKEGSVKSAVDAISRQFVSATFICGNHRIKMALENPSKTEASGIFHQSNITMLITTGNLFLYVNKSGANINEITRIPTDRIEAEYADDGKLVSYSILSSKGKVQIPAEDIIHIKLPNPLNQRIGLSPLACLPMWILMDKYTAELAISYFLRGGMLSGVMETDVDNSETMKRLQLSLQAGQGTRRNSFADRILPKGVKFVVGNDGLSKSMVIELSKHAQNRILSVLGVPRIMIGDTESVNYSNAEMQRAIFWRETVLPLQYLYCEGLSALGSKISIDNTKVPELSDFGLLLEQDAKLASILSIDERRARLGFPVASRKQAKKMIKALKADLDYKKLGWNEAPKNSFDIVRDYLERVMAAYLESGEAPDLSAKFSESFSDSIKRESTEAWDTAYANVFADGDNSRAQTIAAMKQQSLERAQQAIKEERASSYAGFSETFTARLQTEITAGLDAGKSLAEIRRTLNESFLDTYAGQMQTIVNTEFRASMSLVNEEFGKTLATVAKVMSKKWVSMEDKFVRDDHSILNDKKITGPADTIKDESFGKWIAGNPVLRYPRDMQGGAKEVINCRCILLWEVEEYK